MSLRIKLALLLSVAITLCFGVFGFSSYQSMARALLSEVDDTLALRAHSVADSILRESDGDLDEIDPLALSLEERPLQAFSAPEVYVDVLDPSGRVVVSSSNLQGAELPIPSRLDQEIFETVSPAQGVRLRLGALPVVIGGRRLGTVVVGESLHLVDDALRRASAIMLGLGLATLAVTNAIVWIFLGRGLLPLRRVAATARDIVRTGDVSKRVPVPPGRDEVVGVAESFNALVGRVEEVLRDQNRLLADTSHELRNPLTVLQTDIDMLGLELPPETRQEVVQEASREAARMSRLVQDLLLLSWTETGRALAMQRVSLDELARRIAGRMQQLAGERQVTFQGPSDVTVMADAQRLEQILVNLIENAIRHTRPSGRISLRLERSAGLAILRVEDDGDGIAPEHLPKLFERFYRVDPSRSRISGGAGLGLPVAKALAEAHGGTLTVTSQLGRGTSFELMLPLL